MPPFRRPHLSLRLVLVASGGVVFGGPPDLYCHRKICYTACKNPSIFASCSIFAANLPPKLIASSPPCHPNPPCPCILANTGSSQQHNNEDDDDRILMPEPKEGAVALVVDSGSSTALEAGAGDEVSTSMLHHASGRVTRFVQARCWDSLLTQPIARSSPPHPTHPPAFRPDQVRCSHPLPLGNLHFLLVGLVL